MTKAASSSLSLNGLRLSVYLGVYPEELLKKQTVTIDARLCFSEPPKACLTDQLDDTYCYDKIISYLKEKIAAKRFQLVEHFTQELYQLLKSYCPPMVRLSIRVTKQVAIADLSGGVTFEYGDSDAVS